MLNLRLSHYKQQGIGLSEFIIAISLSLAAILAVTSIYITSFTIDTKTIRFSRLMDEVNSIQVLLVEDIKRAGYFNDAENLISQEVEIGNTSRCTPNATGCSPVKFRDIDIGKYGSEAANSCILFAYDYNDDGVFDDGSVNISEEFGYRLNNGALEVRQSGNSCTAGGWSDLTDTNFVTISDLIFNCKKEALENDGSKKVDADGNIVIEACTLANLPPPAPAGGSVVVTINLSFVATLVDDTNISLTASETVTVRNVFYN
jgi:type II secretory pathway component PulJ